MYAKYKDDAKLALYLPDHFAKGRQIDRQYWFDVFNTVYPDQLKIILDTARNHRHDANAEEKKDETITITEEWYAKLNAIPFASSKYII